MQIMAGKRELQVKLKGGKVERSAASGYIINPLLQAISKDRGGVSGVSVVLASPCGTCSRGRVVLPRVEAKW